jgi:hypothetical protein
MKILLLLGSPDLYTPELRYIKTYIPDGLTSAKEVFEYHKRDVGRARCGIRLLELEIATNEVTVLHEFSVEPKKKIVINASKVPKPPSDFFANISEELLTTAA